MKRPDQLLAKAAGGQIVESVVVPPRPERLGEPPADYQVGPNAAWLTQMTKGGGTWLHQARALDLIGERKNVVLATATSSGKSLAFMAPVIRKLGEEGHTALVFYSQKALSGDQLGRWREALEIAGLAPDLVGEIHGNISMAERDDVLGRAKIIVATPDVWHCWGQRQLGSPRMQVFLAKLDTLVIDEAHAMEGVFGSNSAFFIRRVRVAAARARLNSGLTSVTPQIIAASATIADPAAHLTALTGLPFEVVAETDNGAPSHGLRMLHIEGPELGSPAEAMFADVISRLADKVAPDALIAFIDGRQSVERTAQKIDRDDIHSYRSGFEREDRQAIEDGLRSGAFRGVVATSALELGIDIPRLKIGLNLGVPNSKKALAQRIGRIGRASEGAFGVVAPAAAFAKLGTTLAEFVSGAVEQSPLYLGNELIQVQQACCLYEECGGAATLADLPGDVEWPDGFERAFAYAQPGAERPRDIEQMMVGMNGVPQFDFPLRRIGDTSLALRIAGDSHLKLGTIELEKALREAYPGAVYRHMKRSYKATGWRVSSFEKTIVLQPIRSGGRTLPILRTVVTVSHERLELLGGRLMQGGAGSFAETAIRVCESVEGFTLDGQQLLYRELGKTDPRKRRQQRQYSSTGVVLRINEPWFAGVSDGAMAVRREVASALKTLLVREYSIAPGEVGWVHSGIALQQPGGPRSINDGIVLFDDVQGGFRLVEPLFGEFGYFLKRLTRAAQMAGDQAMLSEVTVERLTHWYGSLEAAEPARSLDSTGEQGEWLIYAPGSEVVISHNGVLLERRLLGQQVLDVGGTLHLFYRYETEDGAGFVPHDKVKPTGVDWRQVYWDPTTGEVREVC